MTVSVRELFALLLAMGMLPKLLVESKRRLLGFVKERRRRKPASGRRRVRRRVLVIESWEEWTE